MPSNVSKSIKRYDWQAGTIYDKWDHTVDMTNKKFYVISKEDDLDIYRVYKCLDNGNRKYSLIKPTGNSYDVFRTGDGYLWKYMYEIPASRLKQFGDFTRMPIQKALSNSFYNKG
jgi:fibronectin type 3 domain-containing protein